MVGAGVAIFKPDSSPNIELRIRDEDGNDPLNGVFIPRGDFHCLSLVHMPPPLPRRNRPMLTLLASRPLAAFPISQAGRLPHYPFRGLISIRMLQHADSLSRPRRPFDIGVLQSISLPP